MDFLKSDKHENTHEFIDLNLEQEMLPPVTRPTRITKSSATLIDNILVSMNFMGKHTCNVLIDNTSDHLPSTLMLHGVMACNKEPVSITFRDLCKQNLDALKRSLGETNFEQLIVPGDMNVSFNNIHTEIIKEIETFVPETTHVISYKKLRRKPWISAGLLLSINKCKKLYKNTLKKTSTELDKLKYCNYNVMLRKLKRHAMQMYYHGKCTEYKHNISKLWQTINEIVGKTNDKSCLIDHIKVNGVDNHTANGIGKAFGNFFSNVGKNYAEKIPKSKREIDSYLTAIRCSEASLFLPPTTTTEIASIIKGFYLTKRAVAMIM